MQNGQRMAEKSRIDKKPGTSRWSTLWSRTVPSTAAELLAQSHGEAISQRFREIASRSAPDEDIWGARMEGTHALHTSITFKVLEMQ